MNDIEYSLSNAMVEQGWIFGDKVTRLGSPFEWSENERKSNILTLKDIMAVHFYFSMFYVQRETTKEIYLDEHDEVRTYCKEEMENVFKHFSPFLEITQEWKNHLQSQALVRTQDYCFIKKYCVGLEKGISHLDIGPGLGSAAIYSLKYLESTFYPVEASVMSYAVQRNYFRFISPYPGAYLDVIECENFQLSKEDISKELVSTKYKIKHLPSWRLNMLPDASMDLLTATFVLNEITYSGILWILAQASRVIKEDGYFYIRDSYNLKPDMHQIEYDKVLMKIGFVQSKVLEYKNRFDIYGIPRLYKKCSDKSYTFEEMVDMCLGKFASVAAGASKAYNMESVPKL